MLTAMKIDFSLLDSSITETLAKGPLKLDDFLAVAAVRDQALRLHRYSVKEFARLRPRSEGRLWGVTGHSRGCTGWLPIRDGGLGTAKSAQLRCRSSSRPGMSAMLRLAVRFLRDRFHAPE